jgi:ABC-type branched-subunit amino acid transport system substrate-binding protein
MPSLAEKLIKQGKQQGKKEGEIKGKQDLLIKQLRRKFGLSSSDEKTIRSVTDEVKLDAAAEAVLDAKSKDEVFKILRSTNVYSGAVAFKFQSGPTEAASNKR